MPRVTVEIRNNKLPRLGANFKREVNRRVREQVMQSESDTKVNIVRYGAVDTGTMLGSARGEMTGETEGMVSVNAESEDGYPYPQAVNFGTRFMPGRPFFSEMVETARAEFPRRFDDMERGL
jgi:hypothetical protein